jgi:hypothetical protein
MERIKMPTGSADFLDYTNNQPSGVLKLPVATDHLNYLASVFEQLHALKIYHSDLKIF